VRVFDNITWGHEMASTEVIGVSECKNCGSGFSDQSPCPASPVCKCTNARKAGFSFIGTLGLPIFVCSDCCCPTNAFLLAAVEYCCRQGVVNNV
jgi:hypothetical protein